MRRFAYKKHSGHKQVIAETFHNAEELARPIPDLTALRARKSLGYLGQAIDTAHPLHDEELADIRDFGIPASSYYAEILPDVPDTPFVRLTVLKKLVEVDTFLRTAPSVVQVLGNAACLRVDDALRPHAVQEWAFKTGWPQFIRKQHPDITDAQLALELKNYIAKPGDPSAPTPHATGGVVDVCLVNLATGLPFDRGHEPGSVIGSAFPDYYEDTFAPETEALTGERMKLLGGLSPGQMHEITRGRRVLYNAMTAAGFAINPTEIWHFGAGDPLSGFVDGYKPYYGVADLPEWHGVQLSE